jgi:hypothetical protein
MSKTIYYNFYNISSRFGSHDQFEIMTKKYPKIGFGPGDRSNGKDLWMFWISEDQKEELVKAIRETKIFSRMTIEKLELFRDED